jgi:hydrogenase 3 maturation protease
MLDLEAQLGNFTKLAIVGVGSELRCDDGVGIYIANKLKERTKDPRIEVFIGGTTPENVTGPLKKLKPSHVVIIDAAKAGKPPGTVSLIDPKHIEGVNFSTHTFSLGILADYIGKTIGAKVIIIGIEPKDIAFDGKMSREVIKAADEILSML